MLKTVKENGKKLLISYLIDTKRKGVIKAIKVHTLNILRSTTL